MSPLLRIFQTVRFPILLLFLILPLSACRLILDNNYTLTAGESTSGTLFFPSANVTLEEGSRVDGSALVLCCNLDAQGQVAADIFALSTNIIIGPQANVGGDIIIVDGNLDLDPEAAIAGQIERGFPARLILAACALFCALLLIPIALLAIIFTRLRKRQKPAPA